MERLKLTKVEQKLYHTAREAALLAGRLQRENYHKNIRIHQTFRHDLKLEIDRLSEERILKVISKNFPTYSILTEETGIIQKEEEYTWIIDPLDGSVNYYFGIPYFCICIACYKIDKETLKKIAAQSPLTEFGKPILSIVYVPITGELYAAFRGKGAYRNGEKIQCAKYQSLSECMVLMTTGGEIHTIQEMSHFLKILAEKARKVRILGATGLDIVNVAAGKAGAFFQNGSHIWDFAASRLILEESSGKIHYTYTGNGRWDIFASGTEPAFLMELKRIFGDQLEYKRNKDQKND